MNQANIDSLTARIKVGSLVQILFQAEPSFGLVVAVTRGVKSPRKKRAMTFVTAQTPAGLKKFPIFFIEISYVSRNLKIFKLLFKVLLILRTHQKLLFSKYKIIYVVIYQSI